MNYSIRFLSINLILLAVASFGFYSYIQIIIPSKTVISEQKKVMGLLRDKAESAQESTRIANSEYIDAVLVYQKILNRIKIFGLSGSIINQTKRGIRIGIDGALIDNLAFLNYIQSSSFRTKVEKLFIDKSQSKLQVLIYENK